MGEARADAWRGKHSRVDGRRLQFSPAVRSGHGVQRVALPSSSVAPAACSPRTSPALLLPSPSSAPSLVPPFLHSLPPPPCSPPPLRIAPSVPMPTLSLPRLRPFLCLLPPEAPAPAPPGCPPPPSSPLHAAPDFPVPDLRGRISVNCSSGAAQMLACFRAGAINLVSCLSLLLLVGRNLKEYGLEFCGSCSRVTESVIVVVVSACCILGDYKFLCRSRFRSHLNSILSNTKRRN